MRGVSGALAEHYGESRLFFLFFGLGNVENFLPTIESLRRNVVPHVSLTRVGIDGERLSFQGIVGSSHVPSRRGLTPFLDGHCQFSSVTSERWIDRPGFVLILQSLQTPGQSTALFYSRVARDER